MASDIVLVLPDGEDENMKFIGFSIKVGDLFISDETYRGVVKVTGFSKNHNDETLVHWKRIGERDYGSSDLLRSFVPSDNGSSHWQKMYAPIEQVEADAIEWLKNPTKTEEKTPDTNSLTLFAGVEQIRAAQITLNTQVNKIEVMSRAIKLKMEGIHYMVSKMKDQLHYTMRVLRLLETFMGIYEEIITIKEGQPADADEPIYIRQFVLAMDEEVADISTRNGIMGIDHQRVDDFDAWLIKDNNWKQLLPEKKCIVALLPTVHTREYSNDWVTNAMLNGKNRMTYLLIRNGDQLHRVWTNMTLKDRMLFPTAEVWESIQLQMNRDDISEEKQLEAKNKGLDWQTQSVLVQGLFIRTEVLKPMSFDPNLYKQETYEEGHVIMIRDAEMRLGDGHKPFKDWKKELAAGIKQGTRIYLADIPWSEHKDRASFFGGNYVNNVPEFPNKGIYVIEDVQSHRRSSYYVTEEARFLYLPKDERYIYDQYGMTSIERTNRVSFYVSPKEDYVINYDDIELEDVDFYIRNRLERQNYMRVMPILIYMRKILIQEREYEQRLVDLIANELKCDNDLVWDSIRWYKTKVKLHRAVEEDNAKAWRMIRRKIKKLQKGDRLEDYDE